MPAMTRLLSDLMAYFPRVDTVPGWELRGNSSFNPAVVVCHWTAGPAKTTKRASLNVVTNGRPDLAGPLCNVYLDRAGVPVLVAAGRANHAGAGGWKGVVGNSGAYGIEAEAAGGDDWTAEQRVAYPRLVAAMLKGLGRGAEMACGHYEWATPAGRKTDINGWTMDQMRADVAAVLGGEEMPLNEADKKAIRDIVADQVRTIYDTLTPGVAGVKNDGQIYAWLRDVPKNVWDYQTQGINGYNEKGQPTFGAVAAGTRLGKVDVKTEAATLGPLFAAGAVDVTALAAAIAPIVEKAVRENTGKSGTLDTSGLAGAVANELAARLKQ